jgi:hypothetical protein
MTRFKFGFLLLQGFLVILTFTDPGFGLDWAPALLPSLALQLGVLP